VRQYNCRTNLLLNCRTNLLLTTRRSYHWNELPFRLDDIQYGMPPVDDPQHGLFDDLRPAIIPHPGQIGQCHKYVDLGENRGRGLHPPPLRRHRVAKLQKQGVFQILGFLVGREDFLLVLLQLGRDVSLGVFYGLLADIFGGDFLGGVRS